MIRVLFLLGVIFLWSSPAWATTFYGEAAFGSDCVGTYNPATRACGGGTATAYNTWYKCLHAIGRNDTCYLRGGTFTQTNGNWNAIGGVTSGTGYGDAPLFAAYPGETVTIATTAGSFYDFHINITVKFVRIGECDTSHTRRLIFDGTGMATGGFGTINSNVGGAATDLFFECIKWTNTSTSSAGMFIGKGNVRWTVRYSEAYSNPNHHIYAEADSGLFEHNYFHDHTGSQTNIYGIQLNDSASGQKSSNHTIRYNRFYNLRNGVVADGDDNLIYGNVIEHMTGFDGIAIGYNSNAVGHPAKIYNNAIYDVPRDGIRIGEFCGSPCTNGTIVTNNVILSFGAVAIDTLTGASGTVSTTNKTTGSASDCFTNAAAHDFTQKNGSSCIDAGTVITGFAYNGSNPDRGPFESFTFALCTVENGDASTLRVTFNNNPFPPLYPSGGITGFTATKAGSNDAITAGVVSGTNQVFLTLTIAIVNGDPITVSYSSGNLTDSALIGGTLNQPYVESLSGHSCTNNVGGGTPGTFTQGPTFRFFGLRGTESNPVKLPYASAPESTNIVAVVGAAVRIRISLNCTVHDCAPHGFFVRAAKNGSNYNPITDTYTLAGIAFCGTGPDPDIPLNGTATTEQLTTAGSYIPGAITRTSNAVPTVDLATNSKTELEYVLCWNTTITPGDTFDLRLYQQDGTALDIYTVTPRVTFIAMSSNMGP